MAHFQAAYSISIVVEPGNVTKIHHSDGLAVLTGKGRMVSEEKLLTVRSHKSHLQPVYGRQVMMQETMHWPQQQ
jgi:hypothetical protein